MIKSGQIDDHRFAFHSWGMMKKAAILWTVSVLSLTACQSAPQDQGMANAPVASVSGDRLAQLEQRVGTLEQKMVMAEPTLAKVELMETKFRALSFELGDIDKKYQMAGEQLQQPEPKTKTAITNPVNPKPVTVPVVKTVAPKPDHETVKSPVSKPEKIVAPVSAVAAVTSVRIGEPKKDVTRIVLDTTKAAEMKYDLDNGEHILVVDLPGNAWNATKSMTLKSSPMVKSFSASSDDGGSHLVLQLKQLAKVSTTARLNPSGQYGHRVYLDIVPAK